MKKGKTASLEKERKGDRRNGERSQGRVRKGVKKKKRKLATLDNERKE